MIGRTGNGGLFYAREKGPRNVRDPTPAAWILLGLLYGVARGGIHVCDQLKQRFFYNNRSEKPPRAKNYCIVCVGGGMLEGGGLKRPFRSEYKNWASTSDTKGIAARVYKK